MVPGHAGFFCGAAFRPAARVMTVVFWEAVLAIVVPVDDQGGCPEE
jgi:hypothetical protein